MTKLTLLPDRAVLELTGEDRVGFLQGLVSNDVTLARPGDMTLEEPGDVTLARPGQAVWAALLTPQGKWLADFFILADGERLLLDVEASQSAMLAQKLTRFRLRAKVTVQPVPLLVYAGWDSAPSDNTVPVGAVPDPRLPEAGWRLLSATPLATTATPDAYDLHRLQLGLPGGSLDMEAEKTTLLEAGFDVLHGVSWTKGCYMGQELTARTKYRGLLKRRLVTVRVAGPVPPPGTPVFSGTVEVGTMRSARDGWGLAMLRNGFDTRGLGAEPLRCGEAVLQQEPAAWMAEPTLEAAPAS